MTQFRSLDSLTPAPRCAECAEDLSRANLTCVTCAVVLHSRGDDRVYCGCMCYPDRLDLVCSRECREKWVTELTLLGDIPYRAAWYSASFAHCKRRSIFGGV